MWFLRTQYSRTLSPLTGKATGVFNHIWSRELAWLLSEEWLVSLVKLRGRDDVAPVGETKTTKPDFEWPLLDTSWSSPIDKVNSPKSLPNSRTASPNAGLRQQSREHSSSPRSSTPGPRKERSADKRQTSPRCQAPPLTAGPHRSPNAACAHVAHNQLMRPPLQPVAASPEQNQEGQDSVGAPQRNDQPRMLDGATMPPRAELNVKEQKITRVLAAAQERANEAAQLFAKVTDVRSLWKWLCWTYRTRTTWDPGVSAAPPPMGVVIRTAGSQSKSILVSQARPAQLHYCIIFLAWLCAAARCILVLHLNPLANLVICALDDLESRHPPETSSKPKQGCPPISPQGSSIPLTSADFEELGKVSAEITKHRSMKNAVTAHPPLKKTDSVSSIASVESVVLTERPVLQQTRLPHTLDADTSQNQWCDAWVEMLHGAESSLYRMLHEFFLSRRVLIILIDIDADGDFAPLIENHIVQVLLAQGHPLVITTSQVQPALLVVVVEVALVEVVMLHKRSPLHDGLPRLRVRSKLTPAEQEYAISHSLQGLLNSGPGRLLDYVRSFQGRIESGRHGMSDHPILLNFVLSLYEQSNGDIHKMPRNLSQLYERAMEDVFKSCARIIKCNDLRNDQDSTLRIASSRIRVGSASSAQLSARECRLSHCEEDDTNLKIDTSKIASLIFDLAISVRAPPTRPWLLVRTEQRPGITMEVMQRVHHDRPALITENTKIWDLLVELTFKDAFPLFSTARKHPLVIEFTHSSIADFLVVESIRRFRPLPASSQLAVIEFWKWDDSWLGVVCFMEEKQSELASCLLTAFNLNDKEELDCHQKVGSHAFDRWAPLKAHSPHPTRGRFHPEPPQKPPPSAKFSAAAERFDHALVQSGFATPYCIAFHLATCFSAFSFPFDGDCSLLVASRSQLPLGSLSISSRVLSMLIESSTRIHKAVLSGNQLGGNRYTLTGPSNSEALSRLINAISRSRLTDVDLSDNSIMHDACPALLQLFNMPQLKKLDLSHNHLGKQGIQQLGAAIGNVQRLNLGYNYLYAEGGVLICEALHKVKHLQSLVLDGNHLCRTRMKSAYTNDVLQKLRTLVQSGTSVMHFSLRVNDLDLTSKVDIEVA
ncbi:MAG: hypothetical protein SGPRY_000505, partial [Prymnesium sp.]